MVVEEAKARVVEISEAKKRQRRMYLCKARSRCSLILNNPTSKSKALPT